MAFNQELIKEFVTASHFDLAKVKAMLAGNPALLNVEYEWAPGDRESGVMAAGHMGNRAIAELFLSKGVPLNICVAAMLGRLDDVKAFLEGDGKLANARGAHGITAMFHAAMSGNIEVAQLLKSYGCNEGYKPMVEWLLDNGAQNVNAPNYEDKTPVRVAMELGHADIAGGRAAGWRQLRVCSTRIDALGAELYHQPS
jgi:hypothetical protein